MMLRQVFKKPENILGTAILLSTPMIYWSGKIASTEFVSMYILLISAMAYLKSREIKWIAISSIGVGIKLTCAPVFAAFILYSLYFIFYILYFIFYILYFIFYILYFIFYMTENILLP
ncbi:hypothetical protein ACSMDC_18040 [Yersinia enterocolitica]|uniref:hypothetical protein n=1 Tax=Yersinia enterocolitica TaxID=630 RepID=UPI003F51BE33